jgi:competence protein ComEA
VKVSPPVRFGVLSLLALMILGLVWLGTTRYFAEQRAVASAQHDQAAHIAAPPKVPPAAVDQPAEKPVALVVVHVAGAVVTPGVYRLPQGARIEDAVAAAGGFATNADSASLNLAEFLVDGSQIPVYTKEQVASGSVPVSGPVSSSSAQLPKTVQQTKVSVNRASASELDKVTGISPTLARAIVSYREKHGAIHSLEELKQMKGINASVLKRLTL